VFSQEFSRRKVNQPAENLRKDRQIRVGQHFAPAAALARMTHMTADECHELLTEQLIAKGITTTEVSTIEQVDACR
jgi:hypothetical protein